MEFPIVVIFLGILFFVIGIILYFVVTLQKRVPPDKALIVTGKGRKRVVGGSGTIFSLFPQKVQKLSLEALVINVIVPQVLTSDKIPIGIEIVSTVKVDSSSSENIIKAAERFLSKTDKELKESIQEVLREHLIKIISETKFMELLNNRETFLEEVSKSAEADLKNIGLKIDAVTIKDIFDVKGSMSLALSSSVIEIDNLKVITQNQDKFKIRAVCTIKFNLQELEKAGENFLNLTKEEALQVIKELLENKMRKYISTIKSEEISNEELLSQRIEELLKNDVKEYSLIIDSFNIKEIQKI